VRAPILALVLLLAAVPAAARTGDAAHRQTLIELAAVLGESHTLRQACEGPDDQFWRARMLRLLEVEAPPAELLSDLKGAFNDGFSDAHEAYPACSARTRDAEAAAAARGRTLARGLTGAVRAAPAGGR
jgi:uncharacterized protein (TIGR02301 family)